jgi:hypothetical protein
MVNHGSELIHDKIPAVFSDPLLFEIYRAFGIQFDGYADEKKERE